MISQAKMASTRNNLLLLIVTVAVTALVFIPSLNSGFVNWDETTYITANPIVQQLSAQNIKLIFTTFLSGNYHPLPIFTYAVEYHFFGLNPFPYHVMNLVLHLANVCLVFFLVLALSRKTIVAFVAAMLFGIHPFRVETVVWVADRKDLLYGIFFFLTLLSYLRYRSSRAMKFYWLSIGAFVLSLFSKGMSITTPVILVLLDYFLDGDRKRLNLKDKIPYFVIAVIFGIIALKARASFEDVLQEGAGTGFQKYMLGSYRLVFYYLMRLVVPIAPTGNLIDTQLSLYHTEQIWFLFASIAVLALGAVTLYAYKNAKTLFFGISFFIITMAPVLTVFNVGHTADRFTYVPAMGLFYLFAHWMGTLWNKKSATQKMVRASLLAGLFTIFSLCAWRSFTLFPLWHDGISLWTEALRVNPESDTYFYNRGTVYLHEKEYDEAIADFSKAIEYKPNYVEAYGNRAICFVRQKKFGEALKDYGKAIQLSPKNVPLYFNRAIAHTHLGDGKSALADYRMVLKLNPNYRDARKRIAKLEKILSGR
jgi:protein O-mannosyl-transferase